MKHRFLSAWSLILCLVLLGCIPAVAENTSQTFEAEETFEAAAPVMEDGEAIAAPVEEAVEELDEIGIGFEPVPEEVDDREVSAYEDDDDDDDAGLQIGDFVVDENGGLIEYQGGSWGDVVIPGSIGYIGAGVFSSTYVSNVVIEYGVKRIDNAAFYNCTWLKSVTIPGSIETIGDDAFHRCPIASVNIPDGVKTIGVRAFVCSKDMKSVIIPASVTQIGNQAFGWQYDGGVTSQTDDFIIYGVIGSAAEEYARRYDHITFKTIGDQGSTDTIPESGNKPTSISFVQGKKANLYKASAMILKVKLTPSNAKATLKWTSSDDSIAFPLSNDGLENTIYSMNRVGKAVITATTDNGLSAKFTVTVGDASTIKLGKPGVPVVKMDKDSNNDICTVIVSCSPNAGAQSYEFKAKGGAWETTKTVTPEFANVNPSVKFKIRKGEKVTYSVRAYRTVKKNKKTVKEYSKWVSEKVSTISNDGVKKTISSVMKTTSDEGSIRKGPRYRITVIDYRYDPAKNRTYLTTKLTIYSYNKPNYCDTDVVAGVMAVDNLEKGDAQFQFSEKGSSAYVTYSKWNKELETFKKKKPKVTVADGVGNACITHFDGCVYTVPFAWRPLSYATITANWIALGKVTDFRVKGTVIHEISTNDITYGFSSSGGSVSIKNSSGTKKGDWASVSCYM